MKFPKLFGKSKPTISPLLAERVATVEKWRDELATKRQELVWKHERELTAHDEGPGKELADFEAEIADWEAAHEEAIATEALAALRSAASTFGDKPQTSTLAIRDAWRTYAKRVAEELGTTPATDLDGAQPDHNFLLLAVAFLNPDYEDALGSESFLDSRDVGVELYAAVMALAQDSVPRMTWALQQLSIAVDEAALAPEVEPNAEVASIIMRSAKASLLRRRVQLGDIRMFERAHSGLVELAERRRAHAARPEPEPERPEPPPVIIEPPPRPIPEALAAAMAQPDYDAGATFLDG